MQLNTYLNFNGQCEAALKFYERSLGGKIECMILYEGTPAEAHTPPELRKKIIHGRLNLNGYLLMASDCPPDRYQQPQGFSVNLDVEDPAEAERLFHALADHGKVSMPIQETFWAHRFGMVVDQFGIPWMINCEKAMEVQPADVENRHALAV